MNKPTLEEIKKAINEIDVTHLQNILHHTYDRLIDEGEMPCEICQEHDKEKW